MEGKQKWAGKGRKQEDTGLQNLHPDRGVQPILVFTVFIATAILVPGNSNGEAQEAQVG